MKNYFRLMSLVLLLSGYGQPLMAETEANKFHEGSQYQRIDPPVPLTDPGERDKVEVVEMFFYACPHCYELDPKLGAWAKDKPWVEVKRVPAIVGPTWADQARAYYIAEALGILDKAHDALFKSIHEDGEQYYNEYMVTKFLVEQGADQQKVYDLYRSPEIVAKVSEARVLTVKYRLRGVPAVSVNGKYVTAPYFVRSQEEMLEVLDFLVEKERGQLQAEAEKPLKNSSKTGG
ncbi:MAG TPA: thiol:disulfide interchange protein DsbA/DsbL [Gammaproteobacteria bacterium]|nr:thiol:disulfide interchange protein DsbA/DsbL [Gammaproteobacteria bacterium]